MEYQDLLEQKLWAFNQQSGKVLCDVDLVNNEGVPQ